MRGRWTLASPLLILAAIAIAVAALPPAATWAAAGMALTVAALLAGNRLVRRRRDPGAAPSRVGTDPG